MKLRLFKAGFVFALVLVTAAGTTQAFFSSVAIASNNTITTGTLTLALDTTREHGTIAIPTFGPYPGSTAYNVVTGDTINTSFEPFSGAIPGATPYSYWVSFRNASTVPFKFRANAGGHWSSLPNAGTGNCPTLEGTDPSLVKVVETHLYDLDTTDCASIPSCKNLRDALDISWIPKIGLTTSDTGPVPNGTDILGIYESGNEHPDITLGSNEFVIYRIDLQLDTQADSCYQDATYQYALTGKAIQTGGDFSTL